MTDLPPYVRIVLGAGLVFTAALQFYAGRYLVGSIVALSAAMWVGACAWEGRE